VNTSVNCSLVLDNEEEVMSWDDMNGELSYQHIAELHADAERSRQVRVARRRRRRQSRRRLGRLIWPTGAAARANDMLGAIITEPWPSRRDPMGPSRLDPNPGR
jgi:hypothetical protein